MSLIYNADALKLLQANAKRHDDITQFKYDKYPRMHHLDDVVEKIYEELTALDASIAIPTPTLQSVLDAGSNYIGTEGIGVLSSGGHLISTFSAGVHNNNVQTSSTEAKLKAEDLVGGTNAQIITDNSGSITISVSLPTTRSMAFNASGMIVSDQTASKGLEYFSDYSANFTARSLVDKAYVDSSVPSNIALVGTYTNEYIPRWNATTNTLESGTIRDNGSNISVGAAVNSERIVNIDNQLATGDDQYGIYINTNSAGGTNGELFGQKINVNSTGGTNDIYGLEIELQANNGSPDKVKGIVIDQSTNSFASGAISNTIKGIELSLGANTGYTVNGDIRAIDIETIGTGATISGSTYGIYQQGAGDKNYFAGNVGIGAQPLIGDALFVIKENDGSAGNGIVASGRNVGTTLLGNIAGVKGNVSATSSGNITNAYSVMGDSVSAAGTSTITNAYNFYGNAHSVNPGCTIINAYGLFLSEQTVGTAKWGVYQEGVNDKNYFGGQLQLNHTSGTADQFLKSSDTAGNAVWSAVTKTDVGLGNVENTTLSTWSGSTNITTLGTIATGTWQGTAITGTYIDESTVDHDQLLNFNANEHFTQASITTVGTVGTGVWQGTAIADSYIASAATWNAKANITGTPANNQIAVWTNGTTIEGDANLTYTGSTLKVKSNNALQPNNFSSITGNYLASQVETDDANCLLYGYGTSNSGELILASARGTIASPTAVQSGDSLGEVQGFGHTGTGFRLGGRMLFLAGENYVEGSNYGTTFSLRLNPNGSATSVTRYAIDGDGNHSFVGDIKYSQQVYQDGGIYNAGSTGPSFTPNFINGNLQKITMSNASITINNPTNAKDGATYTMCFVQDATGGRTIATWGSNINWGDASAPDFTGGVAGKKHYVTFVVNGTTLDAIYSGVIH